MAENLRTLETLIARMDERQKHIDEKIDEIVEAQKDIDVRLSRIEDMATRYKGAFLVILSLGGFIGWIATNFDWFKGLFGGK